MGAGRRWMLSVLLGVTACSSGSAPDRDRGDVDVASEGLAAPGKTGQLHFSLALEPATPRIGEIFRVITTILTVGSGEPLEGASFELDARMPQHGHGMMTRPEHREIGGGQYLSEGMKLHMPGRWQISARARAGKIEDEVTLTFVQPVGG